MFWPGPQKVLDKYKEIFYNKGTKDKRGENK